MRDLGSAVRLTIALVLLSPVAAAGTDLDETFGGTGSVSLPLISTPAGDEQASVLVQPDGKIVVATPDQGNVVVFRRLSDGSPDLAFGASGKRIVDAGGDERVYDVALQSDGSIVVLGTTSGSPQQLLLVRLTPSGSLDTSFGSAGKVKDDFGADTRVGGLAIQPDDKIVVAGHFGFFIGDGFIARYDADGSADTGFGTAGVTTTRVGLSGDRLYAAGIQPDGKILASGLAYLGGDFGSWVVIRLLADGTPDATFDADGIVETGWPTPVASLISEAFDVAVQPDGKIVAAGSTGASYLNWPSNFASARYDMSGALDPTWGTAGKSEITPLPGTFPVAYADALLPLPNGTFMMVGPAAVAEAHPARSAAVVRVASDGSLDPGFSGDGIVEIPFVGFWGSGGELSVDGALEASESVIVSTRWGSSVQLFRVLGLLNCGNGVLDAGETCDDGNGFDGDCCSSTCQLDPVGTSCGATGCIADQCDGAGACVEVFAPAGTPCDPDSDECSLDECDGAGACAHPPAPDGHPCVDGDLCSTNDTCSSGVCAGVYEPAPGCKSAPKGLLMIKNAGGPSDKLTWVWKKGPETLASEIPPQDYALCVYEGPSPSLTTALETPGLPCDPYFCFKTTPKKTIYKNPGATYDGVKKIILKTGDDGKAAAKLTAKGGAIPTPLLPLLTPVVAQLHGENGTCLEATYSDPVRNDALLFRAKPD